MGELNLRVGNKHLILTPEEDKVVVDKFVLHSFWNDKNEEVKFIAEIYAPKNIEKGIRLPYQLSQEGKINKKYTCLSSELLILILILIRYLN